MSGRSVGRVAFLGLLLLLGPGLYGAVASVRDLAKAVYDDNRQSTRTILEELASRGTLKDFQGIFKIALSAKLDIEPDIYETLLKGLARFDSSQCQEYLAKQLSGRSLPARVLTVEIAARMTGSRGVDLITKGLLDKEAACVETALEASRKRKLKEAIPVLIDLVEKWSKRKVKDAVFYSIKDTLVELTREDLATPEDWRKWWEVNKDTFDPTKIKEGGRTARRRILGGKDDPTFFGVPISSKNAVFVIDTSMSMLLVQKDDIPGLTRVRGVDVTEVVQRPKERMTPENARLAKYWMRIEMAKRHLSKVLRSLKLPTKVNVIAFNSRVIPFGKRSRSATSSLKKRALSWVKGLKADAYTDTLGALKAAFASDARVNTVYFLSDGVPSKDGKIEDDKKAILDEILKMNRFRKIRIHTFGFHPFTMDGFPIPQLQRANEFLKELAQKTGGTFTAMKVDPKEKPPPDFH